MNLSIAAVAVTALVITIAGHETMGLSQRWLLVVYVHRGDFGLMASNDRPQVGYRLVAPRSSVAAHAHGSRLPAGRTIPQAAR